MQLGVDSLRRLKLSEEDRAAVLENMQTGVQDLGHRVEEMLVATRLQRQPDLQASTFDWGDMLDEALGRVSGVHRDRIQVHRIEGPQEVRGDRALWLLSASNLIENALKYSQGAVEVRAEVNGTDAVLEVCDEGAGIPKADRESAKAPLCGSKRKVRARVLDSISSPKRHFCTAPKWTCATLILWVSRCGWFGLRDVESAPTFTA